MDEVHSFLNRDSVAASYVRREPLDALAQTIRETCGEGEEVYFVSQDSDGRDYVIVEFGAKPVKLSSALGHSLNPAEVSAEGWWGKLIERYDYVALCQLNEEFRQSYGQLFENSGEIADHTLYRVDRQRGLLIRIE